MNAPKPLPVDSLCQPTDPAQFNFKTTADLSDLDTPLGQQRAADAIGFGLDIDQPGYSLFALGPTGAGKHSFVRRYLEERAATEPVPDDWCYVHNFHDPNKPVALRLPPGQGIHLKNGMQQLVEELLVAIPTAFESDDFRAQAEAIDAEFQTRQEQMFNDLQARAKQKQLMLMKTPMGLTLAPTRDEEILTPDQFNELPEQEQTQRKQDLEALQGELQTALRSIPLLQREHRKKVRELKQEVMCFTVEQLIDELRSTFKELPQAQVYLAAARQDMIDNASVFLPEGNADVPGTDRVHGWEKNPALRRYQVNLLVDRSGSEGAPVVYESLPVHGNLLGRIEHLATMGALVTDFTLIKPGALHRANGGYLILDARKVLSWPFAWEELKRSMKAGDIRFDSLAQSLSLVSTVSLEPEPVPLQVKLVLLGEPRLYYLLNSLDPEFGELFKVAVDFETDLPRDPANTVDYARLLAGIARRAGLRPMDPGGVARIQDYSARMTGDSEKLASNNEGLSDLLRESDFAAAKAHSEVIGAAHVEQAVAAQIRRSDRVRDRIHEAIFRGTILIDTASSQVGQVNGLSVLQVGAFAFGAPARITARYRLGEGEVVDIEREVDLGGPIHSKGVLILAGLLGGRYAGDHPLSLKASLAFEQSYMGVEGDSASSAEFYALVSALAQVPIRQALAVTGSVNQHGQVQAIGGVNEKIEGFFDVCRQRGLSGDQGVLIPAANVKHLMLRSDVVDAVKAGQFRVFAVEHVDQGIEILTGEEAGEQDATTGCFTPGSVNRKVQDRLAALARTARQRSRDEEAS